MSTTTKPVEHVPDSLPYSLPLELTVTEPEVIAELWAHQEGLARDEYALGALRLGVLALRQACGQVDAVAIRREGERLMAEVGAALQQHENQIETTLNGSLKEYFDPSSGRLHERLQNLLKKDGELESLIARKITAEDSEMCRALAIHIGKDSPLLRMLSPTESEGLLAMLSQSVAAELTTQRDHVLKEFSLDNKQGALSRLVEQLTDNNGRLRTDVQSKIDEMLKQFSFDDEQSALSRMKRTVDATKEAINLHLTLDDDKSALSLLRRELMELLNKHGQSNQDFQQAVLVALGKMQARREEADASTRHGLAFEDQALDLVSREAQRLRDVPYAVGNTTGRIKNCKKGDCVVELGPESPAPGARVVIEAKEDGSYNLRDALEELDTARNNRDAESGVFIFSSKSAPVALEPIARFGNDVVVVWNTDDPTTDVYLKLGLSVARALCVRKSLERAGHEFDFSEMDTAILAITKQVEDLDQVRTWTETIKSNGDKILDRLRVSRKKLQDQADILTQRVADLKQSLVKT